MSIGCYKLPVILSTAVIVVMAGNRFAPLLMPRSRVKTIIVGFIGGLIGDYLGNLLGIGPFWGYSPLALIGVVLFVLLAGLAPFIRILAGR